MTRQWSRRTFVTAMTGALLSACAKEHALPARQVGDATAQPPTAPGETPAQSEVPSPTPTPAPLPSREEIVARYTGRKPAQWGNGEFTDNQVKGLVTRTTSDKVLLTLDACGGPYGSKVDKELIDFLRTEQIPALLFLNQRWIKANRAEFDRYAAEPQLFDIGNHGTRHAPLSVNGRGKFGETGTASPGEVYDEVAGNHAYLSELLGKPPRYFRTGTAYYDDVAIQIVRDLGEIPIGFDINSDAGTTYHTHEVVKETAPAKPGSIIIGHFNQPARDTYEGLKIALPRLRERGLAFAKASDLPID